MRPDTSAVSALHVSSECSGLDHTLQRFWALEEVPSVPTLSSDDLHCESYFAATHTRDQQGRYTVRLPKRLDSRAYLNGNRSEALYILLKEEQRLSRHSPLREQYMDFMTEFWKLGHMERVPDAESTTETTYYLPHHAVFKTSGYEDKIRVVFNASFRTSSGYSLNDLLLPGPKLQLELWLILTQWKLFTYVYSTDIVKMFTQILVHPDDMDLQRFLWRPDPAGEVQDFRLVTVVYGTTSAPYLALRTLRQLAIDKRSAFPHGTEALENHSYVDDILAGGHTIKHALEAQRQLMELLATAGFQLSKWAANTPEFCPDGNSHSKLFGDYKGVSTLGVLWSPCNDSFALRVATSMTSKSCTKRMVLSDVAKLYDPLGWAASVLIFGKIFIEDLWIAGLSWDQPLPLNLQEQWTTFAEALPQLDKLVVPRSLNYPGAGHSVEFHGFSDASSRAYAAAVYLWFTDELGNMTVRLLVSKMKVAPVKSISIPRLELCGALLLARLLSHTVNGLNLEDAPVNAWSAAAVTLAWIRAHASRWTPFVANRVAEIHGLIPPQHWRYVPTKDNPADAATRGLTPSELLSLDIWWSGPPWLRRPDYILPDSDPVTHNAEDEELRPRTTHLARTSKDNELLVRFSNLLRLLRVSAYCLRFFYNARRTRDRLLGPLSSAELSAFRTRWILIVQRLDFGEELSRLERGHPIPARSPLAPLGPVLDSDGLLRVGGRLQQTMLPFSEKHPLILSKGSHLSLLLVREAHAASLHGGLQLTRSLLLRRFWILQANSLVRFVVHACTRCTRFRAATAQQRMGQLPKKRAQPSRPFRSTGVDYAGPVSLCASKGRGQKTLKGYVCLSVFPLRRCKSVSNLSSASFLAAFRRFTSRRGHCHLLLSDNGTNFRGVAKELKEMFNAASRFNHECTSNLANDGINWRIIPPGAPHFGGLWEAGVKAVKYHLRRVIGEHRLTYEELSTLLTQIKACLNLRPLYALSNDPSDLSAITPGHLLIGEPLINIPEPPQHKEDVNSVLSRWKLTNAMRNHFWKRSTEYIHHLQQSNKWAKIAPNVAIGDLVLIKNEILPPAKWVLARVIALHPGADKLVRLVTLRTVFSTFKRPITKLCLLPFITAILKIARC